MRILVTAGPTHEYIDAVRYLASPSSGKMGFACAREAARRGHRVTLITGPVSLSDPSGVRTIRVVNAREMHREVLRLFPSVEGVIMTAAVSDYRPELRRVIKIKKGTENRVLHLKRNPDILADLGRRKRGQVLIGFALEVQSAVENALNKYRRKNLDAIVLNDPRSFSSERMDAMLFRDGKFIRRFRRALKSEVARRLVRELEQAGTRT